MDRHGGPIDWPAGGHSCNKDSPAATSDSGAWRRIELSKIICKDESASAPATGSTQQQDEDGVRWKVRQAVVESWHQM